MGSKTSTEANPPYYNTLPRLARPPTWVKLSLPSPQCEKLSEHNQSLGPRPEGRPRKTPRRRCVPESKYRLSWKSPRFARFPEIGRKLHGLAGLKPLLLVEGEEPCEEKLSAYLFDDQ